MTVQELIDILAAMPLDADMLYLHNEHGRISIDKVEVKEETLLTGEKYNTVTLSGSFKEEEE